MAIDTSIYGLSQVPRFDLMSNLTKGLQAKQSMEMAPLLMDLNRAKLQQAQRLAQTGGQQQFIGTPQRITREGQSYLVGLVKNPAGGISLSETPVEGEFVSVLGETASEEEARRIREARERAQIGVGAAGEKVTVESGKKRLQSSIDEGLDATDGVADIGRALELLQEVGTGKPEELILSAKQKFGISAANEAELKNLLGSTIISSLRTSFGGNPTEGEREALREVEAAFGQEGEVNRRLLNRSLNKIERRIDRGISAARKEGDDFSLEKLEEAKSGIGNFRDLGLATKKTTESKKDFDLEYDPATGAFK